MIVQNLNRIVISLNVTPGQILYCTTNCIPQFAYLVYDLPHVVTIINLVLRENFPTNTQVWNITWVAEMTADREEWSQLPMGATTSTRTRSGASSIRKSSVPLRAWVGTTTNNNNRKLPSNQPTRLSRLESLLCTCCCAVGKSKYTIQNGYRKCGTDVRVFSQTLADGNSKN